MKKSGIFLIAIALAMLVSYASATTEIFDTKKIDTGGYTVTFPDTVGSNSNGAKTVYDTISQGEWDWVSTRVNGFYTQLRVRLYWGDTSNSLRLKIYPPDGYVFDYFYDNSDGTVDGLISVNINNDDGIAEGRWTYEIYGYNVTGVQSYSI